MNFTMHSRRTALTGLFSLVAFSLPGCVATDSVVDTISVPPSNDASVAAALPVQENDLQMSLNRELLTSETTGFGITAVGGTDHNQLAIAPEGGDMAFEVQKLSSPDRLVIDMPTTRIFASTTVPVKDLEYIAGVRIGSHPGKSRIVLDLVEGKVVSHEARVEDGKIVVTLQGSSQLPKAESGQIESGEVLAQMKPQELDGNSTPSEGQEADGALEVVDTQATVQEVAALPEIVADPVSANVPLEPVNLTEPSDLSQVTSVVFNADANQIEVVVKGDPEYSITRTAPSEYVLTLKDTSLVEGASEPEVVQAAGSGIRSVRATPQNSDTLVRVFAQPTSYLTAHRIGDKVVVQETNDVKKISEDIRAQIDPKEALSDAGSPVEAASSSAAVPTSPPAAEKKSSEVSSREAAKKNPKAGAGSGDDELTEADFSALLDDSSRYTGRLISLDLQDTDIDNALRIIAEVSNLNIVASDEVTGKVTLRLTDVPWDQALDVILKTNGLDKVLEGNVMRIAPVDKLRSERESFKQARQAEEELEPLAVKYLRVSYAKAAELKSLVETVLSERGSVAYDERSNQLIVKDVRKGLKNVIELVKKVDLRTPQVLLETQIVEAKRNLTRELGSELGFQYIQSPSTGNATGLNFPSAIAIGGSAGPGPVTASSFPASAGASAVSMLFDSADGTKSLELRLSQLEQEGRVRIISRPAVATTNNKPAEIKSVEKIRIKLPNGGLSVATGSGASASGSGSVAAQTIEAGITLNVTPQASPDYFVLLDIKANSSSFSSEKTTEGIPNEIARSASSTVLVSSGQTFALGGIYKITDNDDLQGVPFFKDIPVLGTFFRRSVTRDSDEELLFFITPRIVEGSFDDASMKAAL